MSSYCDKNTLIVKCNVLPPLSNRNYNAAK